MLGSASKPILLLMSLARVTAAVNCWRVRDQLPARMAVDFDAGFETNGYTSRLAAAALGLGIMSVLLPPGTVAGLMARDEARYGRADAGGVIQHQGHGLTRELFSSSLQSQSAGPASAAGEHDYPPLGMRDTVFQLSS